MDGARAAAPALSRDHTLMDHPPPGVMEHDVASFDVFDTLISRAIETPTDVFKIVRAKLLAAPCALLDAACIDSFPELRPQAERIARAEKARIADNDEITFDDIYTALATLTNAAPATLAELARAELATERELMHANPEGARLLRIARDAGKRIILCSDMYLPSEVIRDLLRACGYDCHEPIYVSCEHNASKYQGTLFDKIAQAAATPPARILHTGDHPHSDVTMALRAGWQACHLPVPASPPTALTPWMGEPNTAATVVSVINGLLQKRRRETGGAPTDAWAELGFQVFGPLFTGFALWLKRAVQERPPDRILLLARDAHWLRDVLPRFLAGAGAGPPPRYLHVSRASLLLPSLTDFPLQRLRHLFSGRVEQPVEAHLERLGVDAGLLAGPIRAAGYASPQDAVRNGDPRMYDLLGTIQHLLLREALRRRPIVQHFLEPFVAGAKDVMVIDIGWVGNMQASLTRLLEARHPNLRLRGYYVGLFASAAENALPGHPMLGWLARPTDPPYVEQGMWWSGGVELLEFAMRAPHGTTLGYCQQPDGGIAPVLEDSHQEDALSALSARLQAGATRFIESFLASYGTVPADGLDSRAWGAPFYRLVTEPTQDEAELLGDISHSDKAGASTDRLPLAPRLHDDLDPSTGLANCYWPAGLIARNRLADGGAFDEALYLEMYRDVALAVKAGAYKNGHAHWIAHGRQEGRVRYGIGWKRRPADLP